MSAHLTAEHYQNHMDIQSLKFFRTTVKTSQAASLETMSGCQLLPATPPKPQSQLLPATPPKPQSQLLPATPPETQSQLLPAETQSQAWTIAEPGDRQELAVGDTAYTCTGAVVQCCVHMHCEPWFSAAYTCTVSRGEQRGWNTEGSNNNRLIYRADVNLRLSLQEQHRCRDNTATKSNLPSLSKPPSVLLPRNIVFVGTCHV